MTYKPIPPLAFASASRYGHQEGMTLRDYFAGQALAGMLANGELDYSEPYQIAGDAYRFSDAMLKERAK